MKHLLLPMFTSVSYLTNRHGDKGKN